MTNPKAPAMTSKQESAEQAAEARVPNPVRLRPFRTFHEVSQPESPFVFRLKQAREGDLPQAALFEADGGAWRLTAIQNIRKFLEDELKDCSVKVIA